MPHLKEHDTMCFIQPEWSRELPIVAAMVYGRPNKAIMGSKCWNFSFKGIDSALDVDRNRASLAQRLGLPLQWLQQIHSAEVHPVQHNSVADGCYTTKVAEAAIVCTADCIPILLYDPCTKVVAALHAGWRGLFQGIIAQAFRVMPGQSHCYYAWIGPSISKKHYEVSYDFVCNFLQAYDGLRSCFSWDQGKYYADLPAIAAQMLQNCGVRTIEQSGICTYEDARFFSNRRDGRVDGTMASFICRY
jgi:polyphenol oxidase